MPLFEQWTVAAFRSLRRGHFFHFSSPPCQLIQVRSYWSTRYLSSSIIFTICMDWRKYRIIMIVPPESGAVDLHAFAYPDPAAFLMWIRIQLLKLWKNYLMKSYLSHICSWKKKHCSTSVAEPVRFWPAPGIFFSPAPAPTPVPATTYLPTSLQEKIIHFK